jgi:hypothetical protein
MADKKALGVSDLAKFMKKSPTVVRSLLRSRKVKKTGKSYSWNKTELPAIAKKLAPAKAAKKSSASASAAA